MVDLAIENERQGVDIEERIGADVALRAELAILQGRIAQTEGVLTNSRRETVDVREDAAKARIELAKALLRLEAMPRLEADLAALRQDLKTERKEQIAATHQAVVLEAKLEAARGRAVQAEAIGTQARAVVAGRDASRSETGRTNGAERRRSAQ